MSTKPNEAIHPSIERVGGWAVSGCKDGLTKRELFAAMAMQGLISNEAYNELSEDQYTEVSGRATTHADALIEELNKP